MATSLEDLKVLRVVEEMVDDIWKVVITWDTFSKNTMGKQLTSAADSIGANIAEAFGRFHYGDKLNFLYYARGSLFETKYWINRAAERNLLPPFQIQKYTLQLNDVGRILNSFANSLRSQQKETKPGYTLRESATEYVAVTEPFSLFTQPELDWLATTTESSHQSLISNLLKEL